jgi:hypothetical protein
MYQQLIVDKAPVRVFNVPTLNQEAAMKNEINEYYDTNKTVSIHKVDLEPAKRERGIRLYCTQFKSAWTLQLRGPNGIGRFGTKDGKDFMVAGVSLGREDMKALRDAIDLFLEQQ